MTAISLTNPWGLVPPLGNLDAYIKAVNQLPMLTHEEELKYAKNLQERNDLEAAGKLVLSHLRLVVSMARQYLGYGLSQEDLIQEGNIGLMKAVKRFDPSQGVRLASYAIHWIKAHMHEFILKNYRMVKLVTTKAQRKLFFNLRSMKQRLLSTSADPYRETLTPEQIQQVAKELNVKPEEVELMEVRLSGRDLTIDPDPEDEEGSYSKEIYLTDTDHEPTNELAAKDRDWLESEGIQKALEVLDPRSRRIIEARWLQVNDDTSGGATLKDLAIELGISGERVRQLEVAAMKKMKQALI